MLRNDKLISEMTRILTPDMCARVGPDICDQLRDEIINGTRMVIDVVD